MALISVATSEDFCVGKTILIHCIPYTMDCGERVFSLVTSVECKASWSCSACSVTQEEFHSNRKQEL